MARSGRKMQLNLFENASLGTNTAIGQWKAPNDNSRTKDTLDYWYWLARTAEKGKFTSIFIADGYAGLNVYQGKADASYRGGCNIGVLDPLVIVPSMASVTKSLAFGITASTSYIAPYALARTFSSLDHLSKGRVGWNIVTSHSTEAAQAFGKDEVIPHDERYAAADEYMDIVYSLWEKSWEDGAVNWINSPEQAFDPTKIHTIRYEGKYHKMTGPHMTHPSPQRTPVLFQAGASKAGMKFGTKHAECIFFTSPSLAKAKDFVVRVRAAAKEEGRDPFSIKVFLGIMPIIGRTMEEAQAKFEACRTRVSVESGLARFGSFTTIDLGDMPLDEEFDFEGKHFENSIQGVINNIKLMSDQKKLTPRDVGEKYAFGGSNPRPVGTVEMIADFFEEWWREADLDGFNVNYTTSPDSIEDLVELLVPELQRRGIYWKDYAAPGGTARENLHATPGQMKLSDDHPGAGFRWSKSSTLEETTTSAKPDSASKRSKRSAQDMVPAPKKQKTNGLWQPKNVTVRS